MSAQQKAPVDDDVKQLLAFQYEDRRRIFDKAGRVEKALANMHMLLLGKNTNDTLIAVRLAIQNKTAIPLLDLSGWELNPKAPPIDKSTDPPRPILFFEQAREVDKAMSLLMDIYLHMIKMLSKADETKNIQVQQPVTNPQGYQQERRGLLDGFRSFVDSLKPQWKQDYQHGMGIVSSLFEDFNNARVKWEEYKSQHWQNIGKAVEFRPDKFRPDGFQPVEFGAVMLEELEALDDVSMRIMRMVDAGIRLLQMEKSSELANLANVMVANKTAQLQQAAMMQGAGSLYQAPTNGLTQ